MTALRLQPAIMPVGLLVRCGTPHTKDVAGSLEDLPAGREAGVRVHHHLVAVSGSALNAQSHLHGKINAPLASR